MVRYNSAVNPNRLLHENRIFNLAAYTLNITEIQMSSDSKSQLYSQYSELLLMKPLLHIDTGACYTFEISCSITEEVLDESYTLNITSGSNYCTVKSTLCKFCMEQDHNIALLSYYV